MKVGQGIAGLVAESGKLVNIKDAYKHPHFFSDIDKNTGFHTRNLLCFPIKDHKGVVVGVAQLCNKIGGKEEWRKVDVKIISLLPRLLSSQGNFFTTYDEELATTFSVYCGISLYQVRGWYSGTCANSHLIWQVILCNMPASRASPIVQPLIQS